jgi:hypothetical protein
MRGRAWRPFWRKGSRSGNCELLEQINLYADVATTFRQAFKADPLEIEFSEQRLSTK